MFARIGRIIQSFLNRFVGSVEDPVLLLENSIAELQKLIPDLNKSVAISGSSVILLQKELAKFQEEAISLDKKVQASLSLGDDNMAKQFVLRLQEVEIKIAKLTTDLENAKTNLNNIQKVRDLRVQEIQSKQEEIRSKIDEHRFSTVQAGIAKALDSSVATSPDNISGTVDEQMRKLDQQTAENQATLTASMYNNRTAIMGQEVERKVAELQADEALLKYKQKMNLAKTGGEVIDN
jgi:phage shock protein A